MARFTKTRTAKPLAEGIIGRGWSKDCKTNVETFSLHIQAEDTPGGDARFVALKFGRNEAFEILRYLAPFLADPRPADAYHYSEAKNPAAALRALAEEIEKKG